MTAVKTEEFVITRLLDAPRDLVWATWTDAEHLKHWWGPAGFEFISATLDFRAGGTFHYGMRAPNGAEMWGKFTYRQIDKPETIVFIVAFSDKDGGITRHPMSATWPLETINTLTLAEENGKTRMTLRGGPFNCTDEERATFLGAFASLEAGFGGTLKQLEDYLQADTHPRHLPASERELITTRVFDAPRALVYEAWSNPRHLEQWWGPNGFTTHVHEMDIRAGGTWTLTMIGPDGTEYPNKSIFKEVVAAERIVFTHGGGRRGEGGDGGATFEGTMTFADEAGGRTRLTLKHCFATAADLERIVRTYGAAEGAKQTLNRLARFLADSRQG